MTTQPSGPEPIYCDVDSCHLELDEDEVTDSVDTEGLEPSFLCRDHLQAWSEVPEGFEWSWDLGRGVWVDRLDIQPTWYELRIPVRGGRVVTPTGEVIAVDPGIQVVSLACLSSAHPDELRYGIGYGPDGRTRRERLQAKAFQLWSERVDLGGSSRP